MEKVSYPAVLVLSRHDHTDNRILAYADKRTLENDQDLDARLALFRNLEEAAGPTAPRYTFTLATLDQVDEVIAERRAELERLSSVSLHHGRSPAPTTESDALAEAERQARAALQGNRAMLRRLERAVELVKAGAVIDRGGGQWWVKSDYYGVWTVNGTCTCPDAYFNNVRWCKHRLAVAMVVKAAQIRERAGSAVNTPAPESAPEGDNTREDYTTNAGRDQTTCPICGWALHLAPVVIAGGQEWHEDCFEAEPVPPHLVVSEAEALPFWGEEHDR